MSTKSSPQPGASRRVPVDGSDADRDQIAHVTAPQSRGTGPEAEDLGRSWYAVCWNTGTNEAGRCRLNTLPQFGRDFLVAQVYIEQSLQPRFPEVNVAELADAWTAILKRAKLIQTHKISREELSVREHMSMVLRRFSGQTFCRV